MKKIDISAWMQKMNEDRDTIDIRKKRNSIHVTTFKAKKLNIEKHTEIMRQTLKNVNIPKEIKEIKHIDMKELQEKMEKSKR